MKKSFVTLLFVFLTQTVQAGELVTLDPATIDMNRIQSLTETTVPKSSVNGNKLYVITLTGLVMASPYDAVVTFTQQNKKITSLFIQVKPLFGEILKKEQFEISLNKGKFQSPDTGGHSEFEIKAIIDYLTIK